MSTVKLSNIITDGDDTKGALNEFMDVISTYLKAEYKADRINQNDYAQVYLGSLDSTLDKALQFALSKDKISAELELLAVQKDIALIEKAKLEQEKDLVAQQLLKLKEETALVKEQTKQVIAKTSDESKLVTAQIKKIDQDVLVGKEQVLKLKQEVVASKETVKQTIAQVAVLGAQETKLAKENLLIVQKTATEKAQISPTGVSTDSVIGKQKALYAAQITGYSNDAKQKAAKIAVDSWSVAKSTSGDSVTVPTSLADDAINSLMAKMVAGL